ncbi:hypothetical protein AC578_10365 [Pseudocercospora eumusae]|uniref:Uncharacterized protein n=1 Tax=Pseudocercospora eumusae TaxID=321146 RepID=A0A139GWV3_9PEZI|nr:hypothetical protein AC578_10365 [Pseudocercospora eumusae]
MQFGLPSFNRQHATTKEPRLVSAEAVEESRQSASISQNTVEWWSSAVVDGPLGDRTALMNVLVVLLIVVAGITTKAAQLFSFFVLVADLEFDFVAGESCLEVGFDLLGRTFGVDLCKVDINVHSGAAIDCSDNLVVVLGFDGDGQGVVVVHLAASSCQGTSGMRHWYRFWRWGSKAEACCGDKRSEVLELHLD